VTPPNDAEVRTSRENDAFMGRHYISESIIVDLSSNAFMIDVSVIIPAYNTAHWLPACLDSVLRQSLRNIEVLCWDDGSVDDTLRVLRQYATRDFRIRVNESQHCGAGAIRNKALELAAGRFVAFMDSDDLYPTADVLEKLVRAADENQVEIAGGYQIGFSGEDYGDWRLQKPTENLSPGRRGVVDYADYQSPYGYVCYIYNRVFLARNGIRFPPLTRFEDPVFFTRAMLAACRFYALDECVYLYRCHHKQVDWAADNYALRKELLCGATQLVRIANEHTLSKLRRLVMYEAIGGISDCACYRAVRVEFCELMKNLALGMTDSDRKWLLHWLVRNECLGRRLLTAAKELGCVGFIRALFA